MFLLRASIAIAPTRAAVTERRFLLLRHGQTDWNVESRMQGTSDFSRLTEDGVAQANAAGRALSQHFAATPVTGLYASPLARVQQTLSAVVQQWPDASAAEMHVLDELKEVELREWTGLLSAEVQRDSPDLYASWKESPATFELDGGFRPVVDMWQRAAVSWDFMRTQGSSGSADEGLTLVVAHNGIGQALLCTALGVGVEGFRSITWPNCGAIELIWEHGAPKAAKWRWVLPQDKDDAWQKGIDLGGPRKDVFGNVGV